MLAYPAFQHSLFFLLGQLPHRKIRAAPAPQNPPLPPHPPSLQIQRPQASSISLPAAGGSRRERTTSAFRCGSRQAPATADTSGTESQAFRISASSSGPPFVKHSSFFAHNGLISCPASRTCPIPRLRYASAGRTPPDTSGETLVIQPASRPPGSRSTQ